MARFHRAEDELNGHCTITDWRASLRRCGCPIRLPWPLSCASGCPWAECGTFHHLRLLDLRWSSMESGDFGSCRPARILQEDRRKMLRYVVGFRWFNYQGTDWISVSFHADQRDIKKWQVPGGHRIMSRKSSRSFGRFIFLRNNVNILLQILQRQEVMESVFAFWNNPFL